MMNVAIAILSVATMSVTVADDRESGFLKAPTPVCPSLEEVRTLWNLLDGGRLPEALRMIDTTDCFIGQDHHMYIAKGRLTDAARVTVLTDEPVSGDETNVYAGWYTLLGGMRCVINCPRGTRKYHE